MAQNVQLLIIDPQKDFMDDPDSALPVPGANADMQRLATMIDRLGHKLDDIHVTLDSHHLVDVGHPTMWQDANGNPPPPFTAILAKDIRDGIWTPRHAHAKPEDLKVGDRDRTVQQYFIEYAEQLEAQGSHLLMVWPVHCLIGSPGHAIQADVRDALNRYAKHEFANIDFVTKGTNPWTEHYGGLKAEVPLPSDPNSGLNTRLLQTLQDADILAFAGEALTHCVRETVRQVADNVDERLIRKFHLLKDATSPIPAVPGGPDFPAMAEAWEREMIARGMVVTTTAEFLA